MEKLIKGLHKFKNEIFYQRKDFFKSLAEGQKPEVFFITCSDSRINPNLFTSTDPGELFISRNVGNIVPIAGIQNSEAVAIEFALNQLNIEHIIICGHYHCGALQAALTVDLIKDMPNLAEWIKVNIVPTVDLVKVNYNPKNDLAFLDLLTQEHVLRQVENLKTYKIINDKLLNGNLTIHAWIYKFETGEIFSFNSVDNQFECITDCKQNN